MPPFSDKERDRARSRTAQIFIASISPSTPYGQKIPRIVDFTALSRSDAFPMHQCSCHARVRRLAGLMAVAVNCRRFNESLTHQQAVEAESCGGHSPFAAILRTFTRARSTRSISRIAGARYSSRLACLCSTSRKTAATLPAGGSGSANSRTCSTVKL